MKKRFFYGAMALGLLFTACKSDDVIAPDGGIPAVSDVDRTLYVSMSISGDIGNGTRASSDNGMPEDDSTDFDNGTDNENAVNNVYFVFYDEDGNVVDQPILVDMDTFVKDDSFTPSGSVATAYKSVVAVSVPKNGKKPTQVICYINPTSPENLVKRLDVIQTVTTNKVYTTLSNGDRSFAMSNSVYYHGQSPEGTNPPADNLPPTETDLPQVATPLNGMLYDSEAAAEDALKDDTKTVHIYVERYAAKLKFEAEEPAAYETGTRVFNADGTYTAVPVTLTFNPQFWMLNAEAKDEYVIKSFRQEAESGTVLPTDYEYGALDKRINPLTPGVFTTTLADADAWKWNNPEYHRSYWGMSPSYFQAEYPEVSGDLIDGMQVNSNYWTYNQLLNGEIGYAADNTNYHYFKETTVGSNGLAGNNPDAAVAHVIYVGEYQLKINGVDVPNEGEGENSKKPSFYTYMSGPIPNSTSTDDHPYVYFENNTDNVNSKVAGGESMLKRYFAQQTILYKPVYDEKDANKVVDYERLSFTDASDLANMFSALEVSEISKEVKIAYDGDDETMLKIQNNARTLQFKSAEAANNAKIYILTSTGYKQIVADDTENVNSNTQITLTQANLSLLRQVGISYYYNLGHAYFHVPVKHLGWYRKGNEQKNDESSKIDWSKVRVGDFGVVRNHSYSINVSEILGLASGIGGDDVPIVPPANERDYFMAYSVRILKWAVVPQQNVKL